MVRILETQVPGLGVRRDFTCHTGQRIGVLRLHDNRLELHVSPQGDPDASAFSAMLDPDEAEVFADLMGGSRVSRHLADLPQDIPGLAVEHAHLPGSSAFAGRPLGETQLRRRTGVSVVAVVREGRTHPAPDARFRLLPGDALVLVGLPGGVREATGLLAGP